MLQQHKINVFSCHICHIAPIATLIFSLQGQCIQQDHTQRASPCNIVLCIQWNEWCCRVCGVRSAWYGHPSVYMCEPALSLSLLPLLCQKIACWGRAGSSHLPCAPPPVCPGREGGRREDAYSGGRWNIDVVDISLRWGPNFIKAASHLRHPGRKGEGSGRGSLPSDTRAAFLCMALHTRQIRPTLPCRLGPSFHDFDINFKCFFLTLFVNLRTRGAARSNCLWQKCV